jgi:hypothetical protein
MGTKVTRGKVVGADQSSKEFSAFVQTLALFAVNCKPFEGFEYGLTWIGPL